MNRIYTVKKWWLLIIFSSITAILVHWLIFPATSQPEISYRDYSEANSTIHLVTIPANSNYVIAPHIAPAGNLKTLNDFAKTNNTIAAINGGYFDPKNTKTTSYITKGETIVADPRTNERLIDNPDLQPYLGKILNRGEFRSYVCNDKNSYDITFHNTPIPADCILKAAIGAGPQILPKDTSVAEGFVAYDNEGNVIRNAIGTISPNARSAIAITKKGDILLAMVAQSPGKLGMSLADLAQFLADLGAVKALNLDGGSSSALYYRGKTLYGKVSKEGKPIIRSLKSVLLVNSDLP